MSAGADSLKSILFALGANFLIALAKTGGAIFTGSSSMLAEAIHSYADCANQALLLWGMREGRAPAEPRPSARPRQGDLLLELHRRPDAVQHGRPVLDLRGRAQAAGDRAGRERLGRDRRSSCSASPPRASRSGGACARSTRTAAEQGLWRWFRSSRQSELLVVLAEDIAALGGLVLALVFIALAHVTGNPAWDAAGSICIGVLLVLVAVLVGVEVKTLLIGQSVEARVLERMRAHLAANDEVETVYNLLTQQLGRDVMVAVKAKMRPARLGAGAGRGDQSRRAGLSRRVPAGAVAVLRARPRRLSGAPLASPSRTGRPGRPGSTASGFLNCDRSSCAALVGRGRNDASPWRAVARSAAPRRLRRASAC